MRVFAPVCVCFFSILVFFRLDWPELILRKYVCGQMRLLLKKGSKTLRNLPSIWPGFHAIFFWPKLECVRRLAFLSVFCQSAIWCIEQSIHYDLKIEKKIVIADKDLKRELSEREVVVDDFQSCIPARQIPESEIPISLFFSTPRMSAMRSGILVMTKMHSKFFNSTLF